MELRCGSCQGDYIRGLPDGSNWVCPDCTNGVQLLIGCPWKQVDADVWQAVKAAKYLRDRNGWPVAGGWLDQTAIGLEAMELVRREMGVWKQREEDAE